MTDYSALLDDEVWTFLNESARHYPDDAVGLSIADQRVLYNRMCVAFDQGRPSNITVKDVPLGGVPCPIYSPAAPAAATIFICHGGGFVVGDLDSHDSVCAEFCSTTGLRVVAVDYRLSPEHPHPNDFEDAWAAFEAACDAFEGAIVVCGDSAGGNLVAAVTHHARGRIDGRITGQLLIYPGLGGDQRQLYHACTGTGTNHAGYGVLHEHPISRSGQVRRSNLCTLARQGFYEPAGNGNYHCRM